MCTSAYWCVLVVGTVMVLAYCYILLILLILVVGTVMVLAYCYILVHTSRWHSYGVDTCLLAHTGVYW